MGKPFPDCEIFLTPSSVSKTSVTINTWLSGVRSCVHQVDPKRASHMAPTSEVSIRPKFYWKIAVSLAYDIRVYVSMQPFIGCAVVCNRETGTDVSHPTSCDMTAKKVDLARDAFTAALLASRSCATYCKPQKAW